MQFRKIESRKHVLMIWNTNIFEGRKKNQPTIIFNLHMTMQMTGDLFGYGCL